MPVLLHGAAAYLRGRERIVFRLGSYGNCGASECAAACVSAQPVHTSEARTRSRWKIGWRYRFPWLLLNQPCRSGLRWRLRQDVAEGRRLGPWRNARFSLAISEPPEEPTAKTTGAAAVFAPPRSSATRQRMHSARKIPSSLVPRRARRCISGSRVIWVLDIRMAPIITHLRL